MREPRLGESIRLKCGLLIDGTGREPIQHAIVTVKNGQIVGIERVDNVRAGHEEFDFGSSECVMLPGFINAHVHNAYDETSLRRWANDGVTTVRDLMVLTEAVEPFAFRDRVNRVPEYSHLVSAGQMVCTPQGYPLEFAKPPFMPVGDNRQAVDCVRKLVGRGVDIIKVVVESCMLFGTPVPTLSIGQLQAIVRAAHRRNRMVSAHVTHSFDLEKAIQAGVDDVAHMIGDEIPAEMLEQMIRKNMYLVPTLELWKEGERVLGIKSCALPNLRKYVRAGGKVALGTDYGGHPSLSFEIGMPLTEIGLLLTAGMNPMEVVCAGTRNAAHVCNLERVLGTIQVGKKADILMIKSNPLEDMDSLRGAKFVMHNGAVIRNFEEEAIACSN